MEQFSLPFRACLLCSASHDGGEAAASALSGCSQSHFKQPPPKSTSRPEWQVERTELASSCSILSGCSVGAAATAALSQKGQKLPVTILQATSSLWVPCCLPLSRCSIVLYGLPLRDMTRQFWCKYPSLHLTVWRKPIHQGTETSASSNMVVHLWSWPSHTLLLIYWPF